MRRRTVEQPVAEMPERLAVFVAASWGWSGPQHDASGYLLDGYHAAWNRWLTGRLAWVDANPSGDEILDLLGRFPDEPWPVRGAM